MRHLTPEEAAAYERGERQEPWAREHLAACAECRARLQDLRLLDTLLPRALRGTAASFGAMRDHAPLALSAAPEEEQIPVSPGSAPTGLHLSGATLARLAYGAIPEDRALGLREHLRDCDRCAAELLDLQAARTAAVPAALTLAITRQFTPPQERRRLGQLLLRTAGRLLPDLQFHPASPLPAAGPMLRGAAPAAAPGMSMRSRRQQVSRPVFLQRAPSQAPPPAAAPPVPPVPPTAGIAPIIQEAVAASAAAGAAGAPPHPLAIQAGPVRVTLDPRPGPGGIQLSVTAQDASGQPAAGVEIHLEPASGDPLETRTDSQGQALLPLPSAPATLLLHTDAVWEIVVEGSDEG